jgi:hypothetical protein
MGLFDPTIGEKRAYGPIPDEQAPVELFPDIQRLLSSIQQNSLSLAQPT